MEFVLKNGIVLMDGGFPIDLVDKVDAHPLWIDSYNITNPDVVIQNHVSYLKAGAKLLKTNSYQSTIDGYKIHMKMTDAEAKQAITNSVNICREAINVYRAQYSTNNDVKIAVVGAIGTYGAHLHDGSDYTGAFADTSSKEDLKAFHRKQMDQLIAAGVDALAFETIPCQMEGEAIAELLADEYSSTKAWISFQCKDSRHLAHGEEFKEVASSCWHKTRGTLLAVGMNCVDPRNVTSLAESLNGNREIKIPLVLYPNSGEKYVAQKGWEGKDKCQDFEKDAAKWLELGAKFLGGCCRTTPNDIMNLREMIIKWKNNK